MEKGIYRTTLGVALIAVGLGQAQAASVTYLLDQSNLNNWGIFPDGAPYVSVTLEEIGTAVQFTVDVVDSKFTPVPGFGIQHFAFNIADSTILPDSPNAVWSLPTSWSANAVPPPDNRAGGFGVFDVTVNGPGSARQDPLVFTIDNVSGDSVASYFALSSGTAGEGNTAFAAHIAGFETGSYRQDSSGSNSGVTCDPAVIMDGSCYEISSGWFAGSAVVPVPAAVWLFGSGLIGLAGVARRKKAG